MKKVLLVVDYQNDFVCGSLGFPGAEALDALICARIESTLASGGELIYTLDTHTDKYLSTNEGKRLPVPHCIAGTDGHRVFGHTGDYLERASVVIYKNAFGSLELGSVLRDGGYDSVGIVGLVSNICVVSAAVVAKAALPEAEVSVYADCTASSDPELNAAALKVMEGMQINIL